jgi:hypothetical protein
LVSLAPLYIGNDNPQSQTVFGIDYNLIIFMQDKIAGVKIVNPAFFFKFDADDIG